MLQSKYGPSPTKSRRDLVKYQQNAAPIAHFSQQVQKSRVVESHATSTLYDGLQNDRRDRRDLLAPLFHYIRYHSSTMFGIVQRRSSRSIDEYLLRQHATEHGMHPVDRIADTHGAKCVPVIAIAQTDKLGPPGIAESVVVLHGHLHCNFDADAPAIAKEHLGQRFRGEVNQPSNELRCWTVRQPTKHNVRHLAQLGLDGGIEGGMGIAMHGSPPAGHAVN